MVCMLGRSIYKKSPHLTPSEQAYLFMYDRISVVNESMDKKPYS